MSGKRTSVGRVVQAMLVMGFVFVVGGCETAKVTRVAVSGEVLYDGHPVEQGQIVFEPVGPGRMGVGQIVDGRYKIAPNQGPSPGDYLVRITASRPTGETAAGGSLSPDGEQRKVYEQYIPAKYNDRSELRLDIEPVAEVEHNFHLIPD